MILIFESLSVQDFSKTVVCVIFVRFKLDSHIQLSFTHFKIYLFILFVPVVSLFTMTACLISFYFGFHLLFDSNFPSS